MKICSSCSNQLPDGAKFCTRCGSSALVPAVKAVPEKKKTGSKKPLMIILIALAVVLALAAGIFVGASGVLEDLFDGGSSSRVDRDEDDDRDDDRDDIPEKDTVGEPEAPAVVVTEPAATEPVVENVQLSMIMAQYGTETKDWWNRFETEFETAYPHIDLVIDTVSWNDIYTVVNTRIANNEAPDILNIDVFADYQAKGLLLPAEEYISEETYAKFYPQLLEQSAIDGTVWAVPDLAAARALYYNADILAAVGVEPPTTWAELEEVSQYILEGYGGEVYPWGVDMTTDEGQACFAYYTWNNGGGFTDAAGNWALNSAENAEAIEFIVSMVNKGYTNPDPANETRYDLQEMFGAGKVAMMIAPHSLPDYCEALGYDVNWGVAPLPTNTGTSVSFAVMDRFMCFDNRYSDAELEAITLVFDFLYEDERYAEWMTIEGFLPATIPGGEVLAAADPKMAVWIDILGSSKFYPTAKAEWYDVKQGVINVQQQALLGRDVQSLLDQLQAEFG